MEVLKTKNNRYCPYCGQDLYGHKIANNEYAVTFNLWTGYPRSKRKDLKDIQYHMCTKCRAKVGKEMERLLGEIRAETDKEVEKLWKEYRNVPVYEDEEGGVF